MKATYPRKKIAITTGDIDGVGFEVTAKALAKIGPRRSAFFVVFRSPNADRRLLRLIEKRFHLYTVTCTSDALDLLETLTDRRALIEVVQSSSPAKWVEQAAKLCLGGNFDSMVTAPLSKQEIYRSGMKDIGHTDILKRVSRCKLAFMGFFGNRFNVVLASGHIPISKVESHNTSGLLQSSLRAASEALNLLPKVQARKPIAILGMNPHAGDRGIIGKVDDRIVKPIQKKMGVRFNAVGPLVPDVAFLPANWKKYSLYLAQYHDQGLIPFKMVHGFDSGVHLTLGLPIKRSSVDHGTAKDIFGKNKANPNSMIQAIEWGLRLAHSG